MSPAEFEALPRQEQVKRIAFLKVEAELEKESLKRARKEAARDGHKG